MLLAYGMDFLPITQPLVLNRLAALCISLPLWLSLFLQPDGGGDLGNLFSR